MSTIFTYHLKSGGCIDCTPEELALELERRNVEEQDVVMQVPIYTEMDEEISFLSSQGQQLIMVT